MKLRNWLENILGIYINLWTAYGGWKSLVSSSYLWFSLLLNILFVRTWTSLGWWDVPISALPTLLGFTLASFAVFLALGDETFRRFLTQRDPGESVSIYGEVSATYAFFVIIQVCALIFALLMKKLI